MSLVKTGEMTAFLKRPIYNRAKYNPEVGDPSFCPKVLTHSRVGEKLLIKILSILTHQPVNVSKIS
jgi:hypothetical protein